MKVHADLFMVLRKIMLVLFLITICTGPTSKAYATSFTLTESIHFDPGEVWQDPSAIHISGLSFSGGRISIFQNSLQGIYDSARWFVDVVPGLESGATFTITHNFSDQDLLPTGPVTTGNFITFIFDNGGRFWAYRGLDPVIPLSITEFNPVGRFYDTFSYTGGLYYQNSGTIGVDYGPEFWDLVRVGTWNVSVTTNPIPEPSTFILLGMGLVGVVLVRKRS